MPDIDMVPCQVKFLNEATTCGTLTHEVWDAPLLVEDLNEELAAMGFPFRLTGPAICDEHVEMCPEI